MVPPGYELTLYDWDGFGGDSVRRTGDLDRDGYLVCQNLDDFEDRTASAAIYKSKA
jgi:hypothetical protein